MSKRAFTHQGKIVYFCGEPLLTGRDEQEARYRAGELSSKLAQHLRDEGFQVDPKKPVIDGRGWATNGPAVFRAGNLEGKPDRFGCWWTPKEEADLVQGLKDGLTVSQLAISHGRDLLAITMRLDKLTASALRLDKMTERAKPASLPPRTRGIDPWMLSALYRDTDISF